MPKKMEAKTEVPPDDAASKNVVHKVIGEFKGEKRGLRLSIVSYDGGPIKLAIDAFGETKKKEPWSSPAGRLLPAEFAWVVAQAEKVEKELGK